MRRRKQRPAAPAPSAPQGFHHHPFRALAPHASKTAPRPTAPTVVAPPPAPPEPDASELFRREMADVKPLSAAERERVIPPPPAPLQRVVTDPDAEALAELSDLVAGAGTFDIANSVEFIEGAVLGIDRRLVRRLRAGDFAYQSHLDLHGMTTKEARAAVDAFLTRAHQQGQRCVLLVHGRGLNSKDQIPVLKNDLAVWLTRGPRSRLVLAFTSARPCDGGAGALYVLLRRDRTVKKPLRVTHGAKW